MTDAAAIHDRFRERSFIIDEAFATALQIMLALGKPLLVEGPAGVGKTESAKVLAEVLGTELIRLQCYEGLDAMAALYEWNYPRQMLHARLSEADGSSLDEREAYMFSERFLLKRPLLDAITREQSPVLLIDEVDRADEAFEAFLLEVLAEWQVTIPELGTIRARHKPHVIVTSNRTRELSDALRRRCLFLWLPYPSLAQEIEILHARVPGLSDRLAQQIARLMQAFRTMPLQKAPGVAESLDWALALMSLHRDHLDARTLEQTLGCVLKVHEDRGVLTEHQAALDPILGDVPADLASGGYGLDTDFGFGSVSTSTLMYPFASLPENLAAFCQALRLQHGFHIGPGELRDAARALDIVDLASERAVRHALRPILGGTLDDVTVFDTAFTRFFFPAPAGPQPDERLSPRPEPGTGADGRDIGAGPAQHPPSTEADADDVSEPGGGPMIPLESTDDGLEAPAVFAPSSYSPLAVDAFDAPELPGIDPGWRDAARSFVRRLHLGLTRRWRPASRGRRFDLRRTLRAGLQTGGETLSPRWLRRPRRAPRIVLLIDGSRSMSAYARTALQLAVGLAAATTRVEVFTFSTELRRVTGDVRRAAAGEVRRLDRLHRAWAGGTSIGACFRDFLRRFGERAVGRDTVVMIVSDGLDVGEPDVLRDAMRELKRRAAGVVWLNPLLETEGYEPTAAGMRAARPHITTFASVTDQAGLMRLSRMVRLRA